MLHQYIVFIFFIVKIIKNRISYDKIINPINYIKSPFYPVMNLKFCCALLQELFRNVDFGIFDRQYNVQAGIPLITFYADKLNTSEYMIKRIMEDVNNECAQE